MAVIYVKRSHEDLTLDVIRVARSRLTNMRPSKKVLVSRDHLNSFNITIEQTYHNRSTEHNMATLLPKKMFGKYNSSLLRH
jgi:hypothetical protein